MGFAAPSRASPPRSDDGGGGGRAADDGDASRSATEEAAEDDEASKTTLPPPREMSLDEAKALTAPSLSLSLADGSEGDARRLLAVLRIKRES